LQTVSRSKTTKRNKNCGKCEETGAAREVRGKMVVGGKANGPGGGRKKDGRKLDAISLKDESKIRSDLRKPESEETVKRTQLGAAG